MSLSEPEVIEGYREARSARKEALESSPQIRTGTVPVRPGKMLFQASARRYRLQLTSPQDVVLPDGRRIAGRPICLQFVDGFAELDKEKQADIIKLVQEHQNYGRSFWDFAEVMQKAKEAKLETAVKSLEDPEYRKAIIAALKASGKDDFSLPTISKPAPAPVGQADSLKK
jgi:hypothetical protein